MQPPLIQEKSVKPVDDQEAKEVFKRGKVIMERGN